MLSTRHQPQALRLPAPLRRPRPRPRPPRAPSLARPWTCGETVIRPTSTKDELEIDLDPARPGKPTQADAVDGEARVLIGVPRKTGSFAIGAEAACTMVAPPSRNLVATTGTIVIDQLSDARVSGDHRVWRRRGLVRARPLHRRAASASLRTSTQVK